MKIKKGDTVKIYKGKDQGKEGKVIRAYPEEGKVTVEGINVYKKHQKSKGDRTPGGIIDIVKPIRVENLRLVCPKCKQAVRLGYKVEKDQKKYRYCKKCKEVIN